MEFTEKGDVREAGAPEVTFIIVKIQSLVIKGLYFFY